MGADGEGLGKGGQHPHQPGRSGQQGLLHSKKRHCPLTVGSGPEPRPDSPEPGAPDNLTEQLGFPSGYWRVCARTCRSLPPRAARQGAHAQSMGPRNSRSREALGGQGT